MVNCRRLFLVFCFAISAASASAQDKLSDSLDYYDDLFDELESFLDSITAPRTMMLANVAFTNTFLSFDQGADFELNSIRKNIFTPSVGYFHKHGLGISLSANIVDDGNKINVFQYSATGSYDFIKRNDFTTGLGFTHLITKKDLPFYTSPIQNEAAGYFIYRKWWIKPMLRVSYGWGSRSDYEEREDYITSLRLRPYGFTRIRSNESVSDFSLMTSIRHDFYWLRVLGKKNVIKLTPLLNFTSGTQKFGFNRVSDSYMGSAGSTNNDPYESEKIYLDSRMYFQPLSLAALIRTDISFSKFYFQPQAGVDYYFPAKEQRISFAFSINTGFIF